MWVDHFEAQGRSQLTSKDSLKDIQLNVLDLEAGFFCESDEVLSYPFNVEEVEYVLKRFKPKWKGGPDNLTPEHMKHCGPIFVNWLCKIYNCICEIEEIPACFKQGIIILIFKAKGHDPLLTKSFLQCYSNIRTC